MQNRLKTHYENLASVYTYANTLEPFSYTHPWTGGCCEVKLLDAKTKSYFGFFFCKPKNVQGNIRTVWKMNMIPCYCSVKGIIWMQSVLIQALLKRGVVQNNSHQYYLVVKSF